MRLIKTTMFDERWRLAAFRSGRFPTIKGMKAAFLFLAWLCYFSIINRYFFIFSNSC